MNDKIQNFFNFMFKGDKVANGKRVLIRER